MAAPRGSLRGPALFNGFAGGGTLGEFAGGSEAPALAEGVPALGAEGVLGGGDVAAGCLHPAPAGEILTGPLAPQAFDRTLAKDNSLAVGFFQRGFVHLQLER